MAAGSGRQHDSEPVHPLRVSFELFPPGTPHAEHALNATIGAAIAARQCMQLRAEDVDEFHLYAMNRPDPTRAVCRMLDLQPGRGHQDGTRRVMRMTGTRCRPVRATS